MPINFTHAGCSSSPAFPSLLVLPTLSSAALVVNYTTKNYVCLLPAASGRAPAPLCVCVCRLRLILPHSFGSNLSCHAVIMTNKKRTGEKKLFIENDYAQRAGQVEALLGSPLARVGLSLSFSPSGFFSPLMIR